jgi:hypothetical protein
MNQNTYESSLEEFRQFNEEAIREALEPYAFQIKGHWKASTILQNIEASYARMRALKNREGYLPDLKGENPYEQDRSLEEIADHLTQTIDQEIYSYFASSSKRPIYVLDFRFLKQIILKKMEDIQKEN